MLGKNGKTVILLLFIFLFCALITVNAGTDLFQGLEKKKLNCLSFSPSNHSVSIILKTGWNLISLGVQPVNASIEVIFASVPQMRYVMGFFRQPADTGAEGFRTYMNIEGVKQFSTLQTMDGYHGYWVYMDGDATLYTSGTVIPESTEIPMAVGWNLAGYWLSASNSLPTQEIQTGTVIDTVFNSTAVSGIAKYIMGFYRDTLSGGSEGFRTFMNNSAITFSTLNRLDSCHGYWIYMLNQGVLKYGQDTYWNDKVLDHIVLTPSSQSVPASSTFNLSSIAVTAVYTIGVEASAFSPSWSLKNDVGSLNGSLYSAPSSSGNSILVCSYTRNGLTKTAELSITVEQNKTLSSISISPSSYSLSTGGTYNLSGITVTASYSDSSTDVVSSVSWSKTSGVGSVSGNIYNAGSTAGIAALTCSYIEGGVTKTANFNITVRSGGSHNIGDSKTVILPGGVSLEFKWIPAGSFTMGSSISEVIEGYGDYPQHAVTISKGFWLGKYEVTQEQWQAVNGRNPSNFVGTSRPVESLSWNDIQICINTLNSLGIGTFRLPTEAEWEYACRSGSTSVFYWGASANGNYMWYLDNSEHVTHDVGGKLPNSWGLHDMCGNVLEWCNDWYGSYSSSAVIDPTGPALGTYRVLRGGGKGYSNIACCSASRYSDDPASTNFSYGFRLATSDSTSNNTLSSISISPSSTSLSTGGTLNLSSITVTANYTDSSSASLSIATWNKASGVGSVSGSSYIAGGTAGSAIVTCSYTEGGVTKTANLSVTVTDSSTPSPGDSKTVSLGDGVNMEFVWIPAGSFTMGSPSTEPSRYLSEGPQHTVNITSGFWMGKYEVTQAQWQQIKGSNPSNFQGTFYPNSGNRPVEQISWDDCQSFITALNGKGIGNFRLPTEAEWEYACRAGTSTAYYWGATADGSYMWYYSNSSSQTHDVGTRLPNAWGLYDMSGNVWEWCSDWYGSYSSSTVSNPTGPSTGSYRVFRGGDWSYDEIICRSAARYIYNPDYHYFTTGLRVLTVPEGTQPSAPAGLSSSSLTSSSFTLSWIAVSGATSYKVYKDGALYNTTTATILSISGLSAGSTYSMQVSAVNSAGDGAKSEVLRVTTESTAVDSIISTLATSVDYEVVQQAVTNTFSLLGLTASTDTKTAISKSIISIPSITLGQFYDSLVQNGFSLRVNATTLTKSVFIQVLQAYVNDNYNSTNTGLKNIIQLIFTPGASISQTPPTISADTTINALQSYLLINMLYESLTEMFRTSISGAPRRSPETDNFQQNVNSGLALLFGAAVTLGGIGAIAVASATAVVALPLLVVMVGGLTAYSLAINDVNQVLEAKSYIEQERQSISDEDIVAELQTNLSVTTDDNGNVQSSNTQYVGRSETTSTNLTGYNPKPSIRITSPINNSTVTGIIQIQVYSTCIDSVQKVDFYCDSTLLGSDYFPLSNESNYCLFFDTTVYQNGIHSITAKVFSNGEEVHSYSVNILVANESNANFISNILHNGIFTAQGYSSSGLMSFVITDNNTIYGEVKYHENNLYISGTFTGFLSSGTMTNCQGLGQVNGIEVQFVITGSVNGDQATGSWVGTGNSISLSGNWLTENNITDVNEGIYNGSYINQMTIIEITPGKATLDANHNNYYIGKESSSSFTICGNIVRFENGDFAIVNFTNNGFTTYTYLYIWGEVYIFEFNCSISSSNLTGVYYDRYDDNSYIKHYISGFRVPQ